jgi:hypothetical protein
VEDPTTTAILTARAKCAIASRTATEPVQDPKKKTKTGTALTAVAGSTKEKTTVRVAVLTSTVGTHVRFAKNAVCPKPTSVAPTVPIRRGDRGKKKKKQLDLPFHLPCSLRL